jgi:hypothetical protein
MRMNLFAPVMLVCLMAVPAFAGEVDTPGKTPPPPPPPSCTENCTSSTTTSSQDWTTELALDLLLILIKP